MARASLPAFIPALPLLRARPASRHQLQRLLSFSVPRTRPRRAYQPVCVPRASVQQETAWNAVRVLENSIPCEAHRYLALSVGVTAEKGSLTDSYRVPGMYVQLRPSPAVKPAFLAISCAPNLQGVFEFLVKESPSMDWLADVTEGDTLEMSPVQGKGFPMTRLDESSATEDENPRDILLFATGSGIAPIRAVIESFLNGVNVASRRSVKLFYGARYAERMPYMDRFKLWEEDGVQVIPVMSQPELGDSAWSGRTGYVQDALKDVGIENPAQTAAILCGVKGMTEDITKMLVGAGVSKERILMNF